MIAHVIDAPVHKRARLRRGTLPRRAVQAGERALGEKTRTSDDPRVQRAARRLGIGRLHPEQKLVIREVLGGRDVLMVLPTGFGKSACYQIPSIVLSKPVLVISPLLALMKDQFEKMEKLHLPVVRIDGTIRGGARKAALEKIAEGERVLVMTTPETLSAPDAFEALKKGGIDFAMSV